MWLLSVFSLNDSNAENKETGACVPLSFLLNAVTPLLMISLCIFLSFGKTECVKVRVKDLNSSKSNGEKYEGKKEETEDKARA